MAKFEKSKKDVEGRLKEGSKKEEAMDMKQMRGMAKGGKAKCMATGGIMRGTGAAVKGKKFSYNG